MIYIKYGKHSMYIKSHKIKRENTVQFIFEPCEEAGFLVFFNDLNVNVLAAKPSARTHIQPTECMVEGSGL